MQLTERDVAILQFINQFGYCEIQHIQQCFSLKRQRCYQIMQRLVQADLVRHGRVLYARPGFFQVTGKGATYTGLPATEKTPLGSYIHNMALIDVYLKLRTLYPEANWISERQLLHDKYLNGLGRQGHLSDGVLIFPDMRKIAVEVELTFKGVNRTEQILKGYNTEFSIKEVWYFCSEETLILLRDLANQMPFIKVHNLKEFLATQP